jgi:hypothetical protein
MSKAERKRKTIKRGIAQDQQAIVTQDHRPPTKDEVAQRAYELLVEDGRMAAMSRIGSKRNDNCKRNHVHREGNSRPDKVP